MVHSLGAAQFGAFSLAYVTYGFALNASRGLATDPLMVRFSGTNGASVAACGRRVHWNRRFGRPGHGRLRMAAAAMLSGTSAGAFRALGLMLPVLMLQDSWRYSFFALGRGSQAFLNDRVWAVTLLPTLIVVRKTGHADVFWFVFAWGVTAAGLGAVGPLQARVIPRLSGVGVGVAAARPRVALHGGGDHHQRRSSAARLRHRPHAGPGRRRLRAGCRHALRPHDDPVPGDVPCHYTGGGARSAPCTVASATVLHAGQRRARGSGGGVGGRAAGCAAKRARGMAAGSHLAANVPSRGADHACCHRSGRGSWRFRRPPRPGASRRSLRAVVLGAATIVASLWWALAPGELPGRSGAPPLRYGSPR